MSANVKMVILSLVAVAAIAAGAVWALVGAGGPSTEEALTPVGPSPSGGFSGAPGATDAASNGLLLRGRAGPVAPGAVDALTAAGATVTGRYLVGELSDGSPVVGMDPADAPLRGPEGTLLEARFVAGRDLRTTEVASAVAVVGVGWAEAHETIYGYQVAGMIQSHPAPVQLDGTEVRVLDVVVTGDTVADGAIFTTLEVAQQLLDTEDGESWVAVELPPDADREAFERAAREAGFTLDRG